MARIDKQNNYLCPFYIVYLFEYFGAVMEYILPIIPSTLNKIINEDQENKSQTPFQLIEPKDALFDVSTLNLSVAGSFNWKCNICNHTNRIRMLDSIWIMPSSTANEICSFCGDSNDNNTVIDIKTTEEKQNETLILVMI